MDSLRRRRPSAAMVVALLALFVALGGTSYAVATGSIGSREIKDNSVRGKDIRNNEVGSADVRNGSLLARDFKAGQLSGGQRGEPGATGAQGTKGDPGAPGATNVVVRTQSFGATPGGGFVVFRPMCEAGERAVGGGAGFDGNGGNEELQQSYPVEADQSPAEAGDTPAGWQSIIKNNNVGALVSTGYVVCARP